MKQPILFLDVDGVLNAHSNTDKKHRGIDPFMMGCLQSITEATHCKVVLSSTWRIIPRRRLRLQFRLNDIQVNLYGLTPDLCKYTAGKIWTAKTRGDEIQAWMDENDVEASQIVIIDDSDDMGHLSHRLILTDSMVGLTPALAQDAIDKLS
jgi:hypothetical protein